MFDGAFIQMIEHLIAGDTPLARDIDQLRKIARVEIADTP